MATEIDTAKIERWQQAHRQPVLGHSRGYPLLLDTAVRDVGSRVDNAVIAGRKLQ